MTPRLVRGKAFADLDDFTDADLAGVGASVDQTISPTGYEWKPRPCPQCSLLMEKWARICRACWEATLPVVTQTPPQTCGRCGRQWEGNHSHELCHGCRSQDQAKRYRHIRCATAKVHGAIKRGKLPSPKTLTCADCGGHATEYDHRDYSKPLVVEPVCHSCNQKRGPGLRPNIS